VGRPAVRGAVTSVWAAGPDTFYSDALRIAGGVNVVEEVGVAYPEIGREGMLALDPDVVVEIVPETGAAAVPPATVLGEWTTFKVLPAVASGRVEVLVGDAYVRPGPRIVELVEALAATIRSDVAARGGE
jgi:iron complex transport system substrate-binding protein